MAATDGSSPLGMVFAVKILFAHCHTPTLCILEDKIESIEDQFEY